MMITLLSLRSKHRQKCLLSFQTRGVLLPQVLNSYRKKLSIALVAVHTECISVPGEFHANFCEVPRTLQKDMEKQFTEQASQKCFFSDSLSPS